MWCCDGRRRSASTRSTFLPACARLIARLLAEVLLPSPECGLVIWSTWTRRLRRWNSRLVRIDLYDSAIIERGIAWLISPISVGISSVSRESCGIRPSTEMSSALRISGRVRIRASSMSARNAQPIPIEVPSTSAANRMSAARGRPGVGGVEDLRGDAAVVADELRLAELLDDRREHRLVPLELLEQVVVLEADELGVLRLVELGLESLADLLAHDLDRVEAPRDRV